MHACQPMTTDGQAMWRKSSFDCIQVGGADGDGDGSGDGWRPQHCKSGIGGGCWPYEL